jgi:hypothetical protein
MFKKNSRLTVACALHVSKPEGGNRVVVLLEYLKMILEMLTK